MTAANDDYHVQVSFTKRTGVQRGWAVVEVKIVFLDFWLHASPENLQVLLDVEVKLGTCKPMILNNMLVAPRVQADPNYAS